MTTRSLWILAAAAAALCVFARSAEAQPKPATGKQPTQQQLDKARAHFEAAEIAKSRRDYQTAAVEYLAAYELFQHPEFFYNVAEVYRLAGDERNALTYYDKYLELDPTGRGVSTARGHADQLRRSIAARQDALARAAAEREARKEEERRGIAAMTIPSEPTRQPEQPGRGLRIAGIAAGGAGVVSLGVGVIFGFRMQSIEDEIASDPVYRPSRYDDGRAAERNLYLFTGVGVAGIVTGGVLYYLGHRAAQTAERRTSTAVTFSPMLGPSQIALTAAGRF
jgi:tetratricopeptide (TPR) repeat protein